MIYIYIYYNQYKSIIFNISIMLDSERISYSMISEIVNNFLMCIC